eukprot:m.822746 g.822746  ORF g.822746 m.822746 type:complete len:144 (+) comp59401_c1_seq19:3694-4125(+)
METTAKIFVAFTNFAKENTFATKRNLATLLKCSKKFFQELLRVCLPFLEKHFRDNTERVLGLIKEWQISTRFLQILCGHTKVLRDDSLTTHVPPLKRCLETFVYRTKAMLAANNCASAFWLGTLKHRDLGGKVVSSQIDPDAE